MFIWSSYSLLTLKKNQKNGLVPTKEKCVEIVDSKYLIQTNKVKDYRRAKINKHCHPL